MGVNEALRIIIGNSRVTLQIAVSLTDDSRGIICNGNMFIVQATGYNGTHILVISICKVYCASELITAVKVFITLARGDNRSPHI